MAAQKKVKYVRLGNSGLKVSNIILGCMSYGDPTWQGWVVGEEEGIKHIKAAYDAGINTFDTANVYSNGQSEVILGKAIKQHNLPRENLVIMTKVFCVVAREMDGMYIDFDKADQDGYVNQSGLSRKNIFGSVKASLERLGVDYIDVLQCHRFDENTPVAETMQALHDVVKAGYVRYLGMSSCRAWQFHVMQNYAIQNNLTPFISMQNHYNLIYREEEREMTPTLKHFGVASIPWSPVARGLLCRPAGSETARSKADYGTQGYHPTSTAIIERVEEVAKKKGVKMAQVALAWIRAKDPVAAPIVGTTKLSNLQEFIDGLDVTLTEEEIKYLEEPYVPQAIYMWG